MATVDELLIRIDATTESLRREMKRAQDAVAGVATGMQRDVGRMDKALAGIERSLSGVTKILGAFGIALGVRALAGFTRGALDAAGGLGELAQQLGVSTQSLQVYQYAATQAGLKNEELNTGLARLSRTIGEAATGEKTASQAFARLGVAVTDASGQVRSTDAVLRDVADRFKAMPDDAREAAVAVDLFGKAGQKLLPVLNEGSAGLDRFAERARALGIVLTEDQIAAADKAADQWAEFEFVMGRLAQSIAIQVAPALSELFTTLNQPEVIQGIAGLFEALAFVLAKVAEAISWVVRQLHDFGEFVNEMVGNMAPTAGPAYWESFAAGLMAAGDAAARGTKPMQDFVLASTGGDLDKAEQAFRGVAEAIHQSTLDLEFEATLVGLTARETDRLRKRRELLNAAAATGHAIEASTLELIDGMVDRYADAADAVRGLEAAQEASRKAAQDAADAASKAAEDFERDVEQVARSISDDLTTALFEGAESGFDDIFANLGKWMERIGLELLKQNIVLPITTELVGSFSEAFGISGVGGNGQTLFGAVGALAGDAFDWLGRQMGFGSQTRAAVAGAGGRITGGGAAQGYEAPLDAGGGVDFGSLIAGTVQGATLGTAVNQMLGITGNNQSKYQARNSNYGALAGAAIGTAIAAYYSGGNAWAMQAAGAAGGQLGSMVGSLFGPGPSAGPFSLGTAGSVNGRLSYRSTAGLKGGVGDMSPLVNETIGAANALADLFGAEFADNAVLRIGYINNEKGEKGYVVSGGRAPGAPANAAFNEWKKFGDDKAAAQLFAVEKAVMGGGWGRIATGSGLEGIDSEQRGYLGKSFDIRSNLEEVMRDAVLIIDLFGEQEGELSEAALAIREVNQAYAQQIDRAKELGIAETILEERRAAALAELKSGFIEGIEDQILAITDPAAFAIKQLDKEFETIRANAEAFGVGMVEVERLYGLKRQQVLEQIAQTTVADLQRFLEELKFGELSGGAPGDRLAGARAAFEAAAAQALAGDIGARGRIQDLGSTLLTSSRDYNASGAGYFADLERVRDIVEALLGDVPGYATGTPFHPGGPAIVGEQGPELMFMPRGAAVAPNGFLGMLGGLASGGNDNGREGLKVQLQQLGVLRTLANRLSGLESLAASQGALIRRLQSLVPTDRAA